jgi:endonuclease YncB( thermonuclease family)
MSFKRLLFILPVFGLVVLSLADGHGVQQFGRILGQIKERAGLAIDVATTTTPARASPANVVDPGSLYVYDGDTIFIDDQRMRILDIDTPEISEPRCDAEAQRGIEARNRLRALIDRARTVEIDDSGQRDKYGRPLIHLILDGSDAGDIMVSEGFAVVWEPGPQAWRERRRHWCGF